MFCILVASESEEALNDLMFSMFEGVTSTYQKGTMLMRDLDRDSSISAFTRTYLFLIVVPNNVDDFRTRTVVVTAVIVLLCTVMMD